MEQPFKIGQKVVCINTLRWKDISLGEIYTVKALSFCCNHWAVSISDDEATVCKYCDRSFRGHFKNAMCFAPIPEQRERINYVAVSETLRETAVETFITQTN